MIGTNTLWVVLLCGILFARLFRLQVLTKVPGAEALRKALGPLIPQESIVQTVTVFSIAVLVLGFGSIIQDLCQQLLSPPNALQSFRYELALSPVATFRAELDNTMSNGLLPGTLVAVLMLCTKIGKSLIATCLLSSLVLVFCDLGLAYRGIASLYKLHLGLHLEGITFSVFCDIIGGPIAGSIIWFMVQITLRRRVALIRYSGPKAVFLGFAACIIAAFLFVTIFLYPLPQRVSLEISAFKRLDISFGPRLAQDMVVHFRLENSVILQNDTYSISAILGVIRIAIHNDSAKPLTGKLALLRGCKNLTQAWETARLLSGVPFSLPVGDVSLEVDGLGPLVEPRSGVTLRDALLSQAFGALTHILPNPAGEGLTLTFDGAASLTNLWLPDGAALIMSAQPDVTSKLPVLSLHHDGHVAGLALPPPQDCASDASSSLKGERFPRIWAIMKFAPNAGGGEASASINLRGLQLNVPRNQKFFLQPSGYPPIPHFVSSIQSDVEQGQFSLGTDHQQFAPEDTVSVVGPTLEAHQTSTGAFQFVGTADYISWNGTVLNDSLFGQLSTEMKVLLIGLIIGGITTVLRPWWSKLLPADRSSDH